MGNIGSRSWEKKLGPDDVLRPDVAGWKKQVTPEIRKLARRQTAKMAFLTIGGIAILTPIVRMYMRSFRHSDYHNLDREMQDYIERQYRPREKENPS